MSDNPFCRRHHQAVRVFRVGQKLGQGLSRHSGFLTPSASAAISRALSPVMLPWPAMR